MDLRHALFWVCGAAIVVAELLILRAVILPPADAVAPSSSDVPSSPRWIEMIWGGLPAIALGVVLVVVWHALPL